MNKLYAIFYFFLQITIRRQLLQSIGQYLHPVLGQCQDGFWMELHGRDWPLAVLQCHDHSIVGLRGDDEFCGEGWALLPVKGVVSGYLELPRQIPQHICVQPPLGGLVPEVSANNGWFPVHRVVQHP